MDRRLRILLCGSSLVLTGVGMSLERRGRFEIIQLRPPLPAADEIAAMAPDVILFDMETGRPEAAFSVLESGPDVLLLGLDPDGNVTRLWSGRRYQELSAEDLTALIRAELHERPRGIPIR